MRIGLKMTLAFAGITIVMVAALLLLLRERVSDGIERGTEASEQLVSQQSRDDLEQRTRLAVGHLARISVDPLQTLDLDALDRLVVDTRQSSGASRVEILNAGARTIADGEEGTYLRNVVRKDPMRRRAVVSDEIGMRWQRHRLVAWAPIFLGETRIGAAWAEFPLDEHERLVTELRAEQRGILAGTESTLVRGGLGVGAGGVAFALLLGAVLVLGLTRPIRRLTVAAKRAGEGDLSVRVDARGKDELAVLGRQFNQMLGELDQARDELRVKDRMQRELEIAERIQTGILPVLRPVQDLRIAGRMAPADEVGGDYYDVLERQEALWIAVGDVSGHGLNAGLIMLMVQSAVATATLTETSLSPKRVLGRANRIVYDNVQHRLESQDFITGTLLCYLGEGRFRFAGAHLPLLVWRHATGRSEWIETPGTWLGIVPELEDTLVDSEMQLEPGDRLVLYTDGIVEHARGDELFGSERLRQVVAENPPELSTLLDRVFEVTRAYAPGQEDDWTLLVVERSADLGGDGA